MAVRRRAADGRSPAPAHHPRRRPVRRSTAEPERRPAAADRPVEVRVQGGEVDREDPLRREATEHVVDAELARGLRLLLERESGRGASEIQSGNGSAPAIAVQDDEDGDVQRLRGAGPEPVLRDGSEEVLLGGERVVGARQTVSTTALVAPPSWLPPFLSRQTHRSSRRTCRSWW